MERTTDVENIKKRVRKTVIKYGLRTTKKKKQKRYRFLNDRNAGDYCTHVNVDELYRFVIIFSVQKKRFTKKKKKTPKNDKTNRK